MKTYLPPGIDDYFRISLSFAGLLGSRTLTLVEGYNPTEIPNDDGVVFWWNDATNLTVAWPFGKTTLQGRPKAANISVHYINYEPDLADDRSGPIRVSVAKEIVHALVVSTSKQLAEKTCVVTVNASADNGAENLSLEISANGIGTPSNVPAAYGAVSVKFTLVDRRNLHLSPIRAIFESAFPEEFRSTAPLQTQHSLIYGLYDLNSALKILEAIKSRSFYIRFSLNDSDDIRQFNFHLGSTAALIAQFNACVRDTNVYGVPFAIP